MTGFYGADEAGSELPVLSTHTPAEAVTVNLGARHRHQLTYDKLFPASPIVDACLLAKNVPAWSPPQSGGVERNRQCHPGMSFREKANQSKPRITRVPARLTRNKPRGFA